MSREFTFAPVIGDPAGMRSFAAGLRSDADAIGAGADRITSTMDVLEFYGPAAVRLNARVSTAGTAGARLADQLLATAAMLERSASEVEAQQRERALALAQFESEHAAGGVADA